MTELNNDIVSIRFSGIDVDPIKLSELLGFIESESTKSTIKRSKKGVILWSIMLQNNESLSIEKKIEALLGEFTKDLNVWKNVTDSINKDVFCGLFLNQWNQGFSLSPSLMKELSDRNLEISFDVYSTTDTWGK